MVISVAENRLGWLEKIDGGVRSAKNIAAAGACAVAKGTAYLCIGADDRSSKVLRRLVRREIGEIFLCDVKSGYIEKRLCGIKLGDCAKRLLVHALTGFDREEEEDMLRDRLTVGRRFDIDGFCRFRMREFYLRWDEMCSLARRHGDFLADEDTFRDLIRFLVDAGKRKGTRAEVYRLGGKFRLVEKNGGTETETTYDGLDDLVCRLIDFAPYETLLLGFKYDADYKKLSDIFDAKCDFLR